ncbi:hypothetical protein AM493_17490 [Flavobacterium akiainvivens]|uniref:Uncharacterized protein n=1 Tax=Flavobacterium akiainvivens TaxID=1202724 RepID=A0A0M8MD20_9FLAO|nr:hypothetical protein [Flavobacterium akiainvivens]KOS07635.1 hypothetical protein AM493_17490 [Flavobacterium akiainvivens]SFQ23178.1 hypothetical protein SAMN05444144_10278 [Flavobacterium akiainvivens]
MNLNLVSYGIFLAAVAYIIVVVGQICYRNGNVYVLSLMPGHEELCTRINKILLTGYYLVNIGYAATTLISWQKITTWAMLLETLSYRIALIVLILSALHYINLFVITKYVKKLIH